MMFSSRMVNHTDMATVMSTMVFAANVMSTRMAAETMVVRRLSHDGCHGA